MERAAPPAQLADEQSRARASPKTAWARVDDAIDNAECVWQAHGKINQASRAAVLEALAAIADADWLTVFDSLDCRNCVPEAREIARASANAQAARACGAISSLRTIRPISPATWSGLAARVCGDREDAKLAPALRLLRDEFRGAAGPGDDTR